MNSILRRSKNSVEPSDILKIQDIEIDTKKITIKKKGQEIAFTKNEFDIFTKIVQEK
jgi:DNA-binding response OmpR family regulator